jgi:hypothetical protein
MLKAASALPSVVRDTTPFHHHPQMHAVCDACPQTAALAMLQQSSLRGQVQKQMRGTNASPSGKSCLHNKSGSSFGTAFCHPSIFFAEYFN